VFAFLKIWNIKP